MKLLNFHTHHPEQENEKAILQGRDSWGIHPWNATQEQANEYPPKEIRAIGECGLDCLCTTPYDLQMQLFKKQISLSEQLQKPLIIHCVKAYNEMLHLHREFDPKQAWIIHGFRGKPQQMHTLLKEGFHLSFGFRHNIQSLLQCPIERLFLETDDTTLSIASLYEKVAHLRHTHIEELSQKMSENFERIGLHL